MHSRNVRRWEKADGKVGVLHYWVSLQVNAALPTDSDLDRKEIQFEVLSQFVRAGNAERLCTARRGHWLESIAALFGMA
jgi:hypothetical protein